MADAAAIAPRRPPGEEEDVEEEEEEEEDACRICHLPGEADRPLRHPCACRGSIRFVHDDCLLRWLATRRGGLASRCEVSLMPWLLLTCSPLASSSLVPMGIDLGF